MGRVARLTRKVISGIKELRFSWKGTSKLMSGLGTSKTEITTDPAGKCHGLKVKEKGQERRK